MLEYKNPFEPGGKFYNPRITDASRVTEPRIMPRWAEGEEKEKESGNIGTKFYDVDTGTLIEQVDDDKTQIISITRKKYFNYQEEYLTSLGIVSYYYKDFTTFVSEKYKKYVHVLKGLTTEELNVRAFLTFIKVHEGGDDNKAYNRWHTPGSVVKEQGDWDYFTNNQKLLGHPGKSPHKHSAAGAFQILLSSWNDKWVGAKIRQKYNISNFTDASQIRFTIGVLKEKKKVLHLIKKGDFITAARKIDTEWVFLKQSKYTDDQIRKEIKFFILEELRENSQIKIDVGQTLQGF